MHAFTFSLSSIVACLLVVPLAACSNATEKEEESKPRGSNASTASKGAERNFAPRGDRLLSIALNETPSQKFDKAIKKAESVGIQVVTLPLPWDEIEKEPGKYKNDLLKIADSFYSKKGLQLAIELNPIDTNNIRMPNDLKSKDFNDPVVIERYKKALEWTLKQLPSVRLFSLSIGNEVDGVLGQDQARWEQYSQFYEHTSNFARKIDPGLKVGCKIMAKGLLKNASNYSKQLNRSSDVVMVTHYPLTEQFRVEHPDTVDRTMQEMVHLYPEKPVYFMELGYPSGKPTGSSEGKQAEFIRAAFKSWDKEKDHIKFICFVWLYDRPDSELKAYRKYYKMNSDNFESFLGSLGLCDASGREKPSFKALKEESKNRGW